MSDQPPHSRLLEALWPYLLLGLLVVIFFWDCFFAGEVFCMRDTFCLMPSSAQLFHRIMPTGEWIPLWNPFNGFGKPWFGEPIAGFFYPFHWVYALFAPGTAITVHLVLHQWIAGAGIYALCRQWKLMTAPALLAAVSFMFGTWLVAMMEFRELYATVVWGPLNLLLVSWLLARMEETPLRIRDAPAFLWQRLGWIALFALLVAIQFLAGYPQILLYNLLLVFGYAAARSLWLRKPAMLGLSLLALLLAGLLALCLCVSQFLLTWELIQQSERAHGFDPGLDKASVHPSHLLTLLLPFVYGRPGWPHEYWGQTLFEFWMGTCYVGVLPLVLATFAMFWFKSAAGGSSDLNRFLVIFFATTALAGLIMAAGKYTPLYMFLYRHIPGFDYFRWPSKFLLLLAYALPFLAALGLQRILTGAKTSSMVGLNWAWTAALCLFAGGGFLAWNSPAIFQWLTRGRFVLTREHYQSALTDWWMGAAFLGLGVGAVGLLLGRPASRWRVGSVVGLAFANLFLVSRQIHFRTGADILETVPDLIARNLCKEQPNNFFCPHFNDLLYGSRDRSLFEWARDAGLHGILERYRIFHVYQNGLKLDRHQLLYSKLFYATGREKEQLEDLMNVRYLLVGPGLAKILQGQSPKFASVLERTNCLPRAYVVSDWEVMTSPGHIVQRIASESFNIQERAVIEPLEAMPIPKPAAFEIASDANATRRVQFRVASVAHTWNSVKADVTTDTRSLLVLVESWYPGWKALVNGQPQPIFRANANFRGVFLEPGAHQVVFTYEPWQFRFGMWVSAATAIVLLSLLSIRRWLAPGGFSRKPPALSPSPTGQMPSGVGPQSEE